MNRITLEELLSSAKIEGVEWELHDLHESDGMIVVVPTYGWHDLTNPRCHCRPKRDQGFPTVLVHNLT